jgi:hypothetical protein
VPDIYQSLDGRLDRRPVGGEELLSQRELVIEQGEPLEEVGDRSCRLARHVWNDHQGVHVETLGKPVVGGLTVSRGPGCAGPVSKGRIGLHPRAGRVDDLLLVGMELEWDDPFQLG